MADSAEPPCFVLPFCNRDFPLLAAETLAAETGAEDLGSLRAANTRLRREHKLFREGLQKEGRQMLHLVDALPLPLTHCTTCWRATDKLPWTKARLALRQCGGSAASPPPLLRRITGSVFSALAGHRPPFCCDVAWCSLDAQEAYARYLAGRGEVVEAPLNPGCDPAFSYVGGSLRVLPTARLDFYTQCWQAKHGVDSKPLYEMLQAVRSLLDLKLSLNAVPCSLGGEAMTVKATAVLHDFSRCFLAADGESDVMALMGQLSFSFRRADGGGGEAAAVVLPSRHCVLAVVNGCQKGRLPRVQGVAAYVKRRHALRPDVGHVLARPDGVLECVWVSEAMPSGRKSRFLMEAKQGGGGGAGLLFSVWTPCAAKAEPSSVQEALQASLASRPRGRKKTWDFVPLVSWLGWVLSATALDSTDDFTALTETVAQKLKARLEAAAQLLPSGQLPVRFLDSLLEDLKAEATRRRWTTSGVGFVASDVRRTDPFQSPPPPAHPCARHDRYSPGDRVGVGTFFARLKPEDAEKAWSEALDLVAQLAARAISVHLFKTRPDAVSETKSLESAAHQWRSALRAALLQGLSKALKKALGSPPRLLRRRPKPAADCAAADGEGAAEPRAAAGHSYHLHFGDWLCSRRADQGGECANMQLERRCYLWAKGHKGHPKQGCHSSLVIDAYARHYATRSPSERALPAPGGDCATAAGFYFLLEKPLLAADAPCCPMCRRPLALGEVQTAPRWRCGGCGFWQLHAPSAFELCPVFAWRQARKAQQPPLRLQQLAVALLTALHLGSDLCALQLLSSQLKGKRASAAARKSRRGAPTAGKSKAAVGAVVTAFTEDSARGREAKRGRHGAPPLHDDLFACDAGKDNNPDLRLFLRAGSTMQRRPGEAQLTRLEQALRQHLEQRGLAKAEGDGSLLMRGARLLRFDAADVLRVLLETRCLVHDEAARQRDAELATCCPLLSYVGCGPVVTLLCSGHELVRPVKWRRSSLLARWGGGGGSGGAPSLGELAGLHWTWADVESTGLSWDLLVFAGFVSYAAADEHAVLLDGQEFGRLPDGYGDGLTFGLFDELEAATRMLQLEDAATWPAGHAVRAGYSASLALGAHKSEALRHSKGHVSGGRAIGHDPHKVNVRSLVATAPDNHYGSTLKLVAVLRDYFSWMQEDSLPESADAFRHVVLKHQSVVASATLEQRLQRHLIEHLRRLPPDVAAGLDAATGLPRRLPLFFRKGQALCFLLGDHDERELLHPAPFDLWLVGLDVRELVGRCRYEFKALQLEQAEEGQKHGKLYQKFVSVLLEDWVAGGRGRITSLVSSGSLASRTACQNVVRSWMTALALATGVGPLELQESLCSEGAFLRGALHGSRRLSASALAVLRRRVPRASVSNLGPLVAGRRGRYLGQCVQLMMSVLTAAQDASRPNGSVNGLNENERHAPGAITLDPIMTLLYHSYGLSHKEPSVAGGGGAPSICGACRQLICGCESDKAARRSVNVDESFCRHAELLRSLNIDLSLRPLEREERGGGGAAVAEPLPPPPPPPPGPCTQPGPAAGAAVAEPPPEDGRWAAVGARMQPYLTMADARRGAAPRPAAVPRCEEVELEGSRLGLAFGSGAASPLLADQFVFALRDLGHEAAWLSGDQTRGDTVLAHGDRGLFARALTLAAEKVEAATKELQGGGRGCEPPLHLGSLSPCRGGDAGLRLGVEPGGTLQLQARGDALKQALIGITGYGNGAKRVCRAFLAEPPRLRGGGGAALGPLRNGGCSPKESSHEQQLRAQFERNVLGYLYLATTLEVLPVASQFKRQLPRRVEARLHFSDKPGAAAVCASDLLVDGRRLFVRDVVLGPNPRHRGWLCGEQAEGLDLVLLLHEAPLTHSATRWELLEALAEELRVAEQRGVPPAPELLARLDAAATSSVPALVGIDQRPVFLAAVRDDEAFEALDPAVCGYGVFEAKDAKEAKGATDTKAAKEAKEAKGALREASLMHCCGCMDCCTYFRGADAASSQNPLKEVEDLEDLTISAAQYFARNNHGARRAMFERRSTGKVARRGGGPPVRISRQEGWWCFHCHTDEDLGAATAARPAASRSLEAWPGVKLLLRDVPPPTPLETEAEEAWLAEFERDHGGPEQWLQRARSALHLLVACGEELAAELRELADRLDDT